MADEADKANEVAQAQRDKAIQVRVDVPHLEPVGECHNCFQSVGPRQIYCNSACADEHAYYLHRLAVNKGNV